jgi:hypothetical protein
MGGPSLVLGRKCWTCKTNRRAGVGIGGMKEAEVKTFQIRTCCFVAAGCFCGPGVMNARRERYIKGGEGNTKGHLGSSW